MSAFAALAGAGRPILVAGEEGGCGATTVAALLAETCAAARVGGVLAVDQSRLPCSGGLGLRLLGEPVDFPAPSLATAVHNGQAPPMSPAGAVVVTDVQGYTPLARLLSEVPGQVAVTVTDFGHVDLAVAAQLAETPYRPVLVGRADVAGAQAVCAALVFLRVRPVVVLSSTAHSNRRRVRAALTLVRSAGVQALVHLPFDAALASGMAVHLDQIGRTTIRACLQLAARVGTPGEVGNHVHLLRNGPPGGPGPGTAAAARWPGFQQHRPGQ
ncbi:hypothetical protein ACFWQL_05345 [Amycolatopsis thermoflava]|uniref:hypothetical protein n=1 Tax=Amycolatopsis thermoflava TaxID=84480 RepID=UPI003665B757